MTIHATMRKVYQQIADTVETAKAELAEEAEATETPAAEGQQQSTAPSFMQLVQGTLKHAGKQVTALFDGKPNPVVNKPTPTVVVSVPVEKPIESINPIVNVVVEAPIEPTKPIVNIVVEAPIEPTKPVVAVVVEAPVPAVQPTPIPQLVPAVITQEIPVVPPSTGISQLLSMRLQR